MTDVDEGDESNAGELYSERGRTRENSTIKFIHYRVGKGKPNRRQHSPK